MCVVCVPSDEVKANMTWSHFQFVISHNRDTEGTASMFFLPCLNKIVRMYTCKCSLQLDCVMVAS